MPVRIQIRETVIDDYDRLCDLFEEVDRIHREAMPDLFSEHGGPTRSIEYVGGMLLEAAHARAQRNGVTGAHLNVWEFNTPAIRFYEKAGYVTGRRMMRKILE